MIAASYHAVLEDIERVSQSCGRISRDISLVVVTKGHSPEKIEQVIEAGASRLGESYVDEAITKIPSVPSHRSIEWHMIGHVQSRKARSVCEFFSWIHSVDSYKLANRFGRFIAEGGRKPAAILLECNVSGEESKFGYPAWNPASWPILVEEFAPILELENIQVRGLMTIAPYYDDPQRARPVFRQLRLLRDFLSKELPGDTWEELSMGMSGDYQVAIEEGATIVRIGTAIMGPRPE